MNIVDRAADGFFGVLKRECFNRYHYVIHTETSSGIFDCVFQSQDPSLVTCTDQTVLASLRSIGLEPLNTYCVLVD